jgi:predicted RNA-binding protein
MKYWLCITNQENWDIIKEKGIWGVSARHKGTIQEVRPGDKLLIYVVSTRLEKEIIPSKIVAAYEVSSELFEDRTMIFKPNRKGEPYPLRVKLKEVKIFPTPVEFKPMIQRLTFIKNKKKWSGHIQGKAMREIPAEDYELLFKQVKAI